MADACVCLAMLGVALASVSTSEAEVAMLRVCATRGARALPSIAATSSAMLARGGPSTCPTRSSSSASSRSSIAFLDVAELERGLLQSPAPQLAECSALPQHQLQHQLQRRWLTGATTFESAEIPERLNAGTSSYGSRPRMRLAPAEASPGARMAIQHNITSSKES